MIREEDIAILPHRELGDFTDEKIYTHKDFTGSVEYTI